MCVYIIHIVDHCHNCAGYYTELMTLLFNQEEPSYIQILLDIVKGSCVATHYCQGSHVMSHESLWLVCAFVAPPHTVKVGHSDLIDSAGLEY